MTRWRHSLLAAVAAFAAGCGSSNKQPPEPVDRVGDLSVDASKAGAVVARVNGVPVYADCVAAQVENDRAKTKQDALQQCIDFELLAQEAVRRGFVTGRDLVEVRKREAVRAFIETDFAPSFDSPEDVPEEDLRRAYERAKPRYVHPELRRVTYVRAMYPKNTPPGTPEDLAARHMINEVYQALKGPRVFAWRLPRYDLELDQLRFLARRATDNRIGIPEQADFTFKRWGPVHESFRKPSFEIPRPGMISPPVRTPWGWDIILLLDIIPPKNETFEEAKPDLQKFLFANARGRAFLRWAEQFVSIRTINRAIQTQAMDELKRMQQAEDAATLPPLPSTDPS